MSQMVTGGYVRHRNRMIQESVFQDLRDTLIACRWMSGTTSHPVVDPDDPGAGWQLITTTLGEVLKLVGTRDDGTVAEVVLIDFFPEAGRTNDGENPTGEVESRKTEKNTLAVNSGEAQDPEYVELGSNMQEQQYVFTMAFYASSDAVALAVLSDLRDRYMGRIVSDDNLNLYNYNDPSFDVDTPPVARMEVDAFRFQMNTDTQVSPAEVHLYFAELVLTDHVDAFAPPVPAPEPANWWPSYAIGDPITADQGLVLNEFGVYELDPNPTFFFAEVPITDGSTYDLPSDEGLCILARLYEITANDGSVAPGIEVGTWVITQLNASPEPGVTEVVANFALDTTAADLAAVGLTVAARATGVHWRSEVTTPFAVIAV